MPGPESVTVHHAEAPASQSTSRPWPPACSTTLVITSLTARTKLCSLSPAKPDVLSRSEIWCRTTVISSRPNVRSTRNGSSAGAATTASADSAPGAVRTSWPKGGPYVSFTDVQPTLCDAGTADG